MKRFCTVLAITVLLIFTVTVSCFAETFNATLGYDGATHQYSGAYFTVTIDGEEVESPIPPIVLENDRSLVCMREIFEKTGAKVAWIEKEQKVIVSSNNTSVSLKIGSLDAVVNGKSVELETAPRLVAYKGIGKTMVPVRFIAEALDMTVGFDSSENIISIDRPVPTPMPTGRPTPTSSPTPKPTAAPSVTPNPDFDSYALSISADENGNDELVAKIYFDSPVNSYSPLVLSDPNRVVVDVLGAGSKLSQANYELSGNVSKIRTGIYNGNFRIVFDADILPEYDISLSSNKKVMTVEVSLPDPNEKPDPLPGFSDNDDDGPLNPIVVIDAGHGGDDVGAIGYNEDGSVSAYEKDINLAVANKVVAILEENDVEVCFTRNTDKTVSLDQRVVFANSLDASLFVSVHCNAYTTTDVNGSLVMYHTTKDTSEYGVSGKDLASNILTPLVEALGTYDRGLMKGDTMYVIRKVNMPSVIVELAFITNENDRNKLTDEEYQDAMAAAIAEGILKTLENVIK